MVSLGQALLDLVLPRVCAGCGTRDTLGPFCAACLPSLISPLGQPCPGRVGMQARASMVGQNRNVQSVQAPLVYGGQVARAIQQLKYGGASHLARPLGQLMRPAMAQLPAGLDGAVPAPLHPRRLRARGYNQAALLARVACAGRLPVRHDLLRRIRDTPAQKDLTPTERRVNVQGAFSAGTGAHGLRLLLVDDVATTGATATACAAALLDAGALEVHLLTLARAVP